MSIKAPDIATAAANAAAAKQQLIDTVAELKLRLSPGYIAKSAAQSAKRSAISAANTTIDTVENRPYVVSGAIAALGIFFARKRIAGLFRTDKKPSPPSSLAPSAPRKRAAPRRRTSSSQSSSKRDNHHDHQHSLEETSSRRSWR